MMWVVVERVVVPRKLPLQLQVPPLLVRQRRSDGSEGCTPGTVLRQEVDGGNALAPMKSHELSLTDTPYRVDSVAVEILT